MVAYAMHDIDGLISTSFFKSFCSKTTLAMKRKRNAMFGGTIGPDRRSDKASKQTVIGINVCGAAY